MTVKTSPFPVSSAAQKPKKSRTIEQQQRTWGWIFISPWLIGFFIFTAFPMIASFIFSFTDFTIGQEMHWVGLKNWQKMITDPVTLNSFGVTLKFAVIMLPVSMIVPLALATLLTSRVLPMKPIFRILFYMPYMIPAISTIFIWQSFLNGQTGWLSRFLRVIGINNPPDWLQGAYLHTGLLFIGLWGIGNIMLTMMSSMQGVPTELYEAANVDGANRFTTWYRITLPMISPVIFYNLVLAIIGLMQYFTIPYVLSSSNTSQSNSNLNFINLHLYRTAFRYQDMGYGSALGWLMFAIGLVFTIALFISSRRWVYYTSGDK